MAPNLAHPIVGDDKSQRSGMSKRYGLGLFNPEVSASSIPGAYSTCEESAFRVAVVEKLDNTFFIS